MKTRSWRHGFFCALVLTLATVAVRAETSSALPTISGPLTIADAVLTALKYNPMLQAAGFQASAAQARVGMAKAMTRPLVAVSAFAGKSSMGDIVTSPPNIMPSAILAFPNKGAVVGQAGFMFPIYTGGRLNGVVRSAEALSAAAGSDRVSVEQEVSLETRTAYHGALLTSATVEVYRDLVNEERERVRIAEAAFREGKIAKYDLLRNQSGLAEAEQQLANAERDSRIGIVEMKAALGVSQSSDISLADQLAYCKVTETLDSLVERAIENRPELSAARSRVRSALKNVDVAKSAYSPVIYASAMQGITSTSDGSDSGLTAGVAVGIPLVDGGGRRAAVAEARAMLEAMKREEQQAVVGIERDVHTAWAEVQAADKNVGLSEAAVAQAGEDYRVIKLRYEAGKAINVEVLDALASLVRARNNRLTALYEHSVAGDKLARAIGELRTGGSP